MEFVGVSEIAKKWGVSERTVRNDCATGKVPGAFLQGKTWKIPVDAVRPVHKKNKLLEILKQQKESHLKGGIYHKIQVAFAYNSNHIEGSTLTEEQTRFIYETKTIGVQKQSVNVDDIIETINHFKCVDYVIDNALKPLTQKFIKKLHYILKSSTTDSQKVWFNVGEYKKLPNEIGGEQTCLPENVEQEMENLLRKYSSIKNKRLEDIVEFHQKFEKIHPFQDGNGRVGRLIMFKECLANNIVPFIIDDKYKTYYYRGLKEWDSERGFLLETCLFMQDNFKKWLEYFRI